MILFRDLSDMEATNILVKRPRQYLGKRGLAESEA